MGPDRQCGHRPQRELSGYKPTTLAWNFTLTRFAGWDLYPAQQGPQGADNATDASVNCGWRLLGNYFSTGVVGATIAGGGEQHYGRLSKGAKIFPTR